jgi:hypothetical protein
VRTTLSTLIAKNLYEETTETTPYEVSCCYFCTERTLTAWDIISREVRTTLITKNLYEETLETTLMRY